MPSKNEAPAAGTPGSDREPLLTRVLNAPREKVYRA